MNIIGFSSGGMGRVGNTDRLVRAILEKSGQQYEYVKLTDLNFSGCKGCSDLCAQDRLCHLEDDATPYYRKIKEADAVVLGSPVYSGSINGIANSFIGRFFGYRHVTPALKGKPFVLAVCGFRRIEQAVEQLHRKLKFNGIDIIDTVTYLSEGPPCLICGRHQVCSIGGLYGMIGEAAHTLEITPDCFHAWEDDPAVVSAVETAAAKLRDL